MKERHNVLKSEILIIHYHIYIIFGFGFITFAIIFLIIFPSNYFNL